MKRINNSNEALIAIENGETVVCGDHWWNMQNGLINSNSKFYFPHQSHFDIGVYIKPRTINIGGVELEAPLTSFDDVKEFWLMFDKDEPIKPYAIEIWANVDLAINWLKQGRCFATKEARDAAEQAWRKAVRND